MLRLQQVFVLGYCIAPAERGPVHVGCGEGIG